MPTPVLPEPAAGVDVVVVVLNGVVDVVGVVVVLEVVLEVVLGVQDFCLAPVHGRLIPGGRLIPETAWFEPLTTVEPSKPGSCDAPAPSMSPTVRAATAAVFELNMPRLSRRYFMAA